MPGRALRGPALGLDSNSQDMSAKNPWEETAPHLTADEGLRPEREEPDPANKGQPWGQSLHLLTPWPQLRPLPQTDLTPTPLLCSLLSPYAGQALGPE